METTTSTTNILDLVKDLQIDSQPLYLCKSKTVKLGDDKKSIDASRISFFKLECIATKHDKCIQVEMQSICVDIIAAQSLYPSCRNVPIEHSFEATMMSATNISMNTTHPDIDSVYLQSICKDCVVTAELVWLSMQNIANQHQTLKSTMLCMLQHLQIQQHQTQQS